MNEVYRKEKKFLLNFIEYKKYSAQLEKIMDKDIHSGDEGYTIRSLYFDTLNDKDYEEKELGVRIRRKIRLRIYDVNQDFAMLEMKQKNGEIQLKRSLRLSREDAIKLIKGEYEVLLKYNETFAAECYSVMQIGCYRPKSVIEYKRQAFIAKENQIRITFDHDIKASESNFNIFDKDLVLNSVFNKSNVVLEVKYNGFLLSYIKTMLNMIDKSEISVGKYCLGRITTKHYKY